METATKSAALNPDSAKRDWLKWASIFLTCIGLFIAGYLVQAKIFNTEIVCTKSGAIDCDAVQRSIYSQVGPIPVVYLGFVGYIGILLVLLLETRIPFVAARGKLIVFAMTLFGLLFSGYLTAIEAFVLQKWCEWCVGSAITMTLLFIISFARLWQSMNVLPLEDEE